MVRLVTQTGAFVGTTDTRVGLVERTLRCNGVPYEFIGERAGMREYRAMEPIPVPRPQRVHVVNTSGSDLGTVSVPAGAPPPSVVFDDVTCALWTTKDQAGRVLYLKPDPPITRVIRGPRGRFQRAR